MKDERIRRIAGDARYQALIRRRGRYAWTLSGMMLAAYFGFILLVAFDKPLLARPVGGGVTSLGILIGFTLIVLAVALTGLYVRRANREFAPMVAELIAEHSE